MMKTYISVNTVSHALLLLEDMYKFNCFSLDEINQIPVIYGLNRKSALELMSQCQWVSIHDREVSVTEVGKKIHALFDGIEISQPLWMTILEQYILVCRPAWAARIPMGRQETYIIMSDQEKGCFSEADILYSYDDEVVDWWDRIAGKIRYSNNLNLEIIGRKGEKLTLKYEKFKKGIQPRWYSLESNLAGYDIISQKTAIDNEEIFIEVKSSTKSLDNACFYISRNEWNMANSKHNQGRYFFYLWIINENENKLAIVDRDEMFSCIPVDSGSGLWQQVEIPFKVYSDKLMTVNL